MSESPASAASQTPRLTGAEIVWATLEGEGVREVFGYPGGAILPVYDALRKYPIRHILVRHGPDCHRASRRIRRHSVLLQEISSRSSLRWRHRHSRSRRPLLFKARLEA